MKIHNSPGVLIWHEDTKFQYHNRDFVFDVHPFLIERNQLPPFQLIVDSSVGAITSLDLVRYDDGVRTSILSLATTAGFQLVDYGTFKAIIYPSTTLLTPASDFEVGVYTAEMSDGTTTFYSEAFKMCLDLSDHIKIEWCHANNFELQNGRFITYGQGYENKVFLCTDIGKPSFRYEEDVDPRDGVNLPVKQVAYKLHNFEAVLPEPIIDALFYARLHDFLKIYHFSKVHSVDENANLVGGLIVDDLYIIEFPNLYDITDGFVKLLIDISS